MKKRSYVHEYRPYFYAFAKLPEILTAITGIALILLGICDATDRFIFLSIESEAACLLLWIAIAIGSSVVGYFLTKLVISPLILAVEYQRRTADVLRRRERERLAERERNELLLTLDKDQEGFHDHIPPASAPSEAYKCKVCGAIALGDSCTACGAPRN